MRDWFDDKNQQVDQNTLNAFGIELSSRHGKAYELIEMLKFATEAAAKSLDSYIERLFYDSKACICSIEFHSAVQDGDFVAKEVKKIAEQTISQFMIFDDVDHGPIPEEDE